MLSFFGADVSSMKFLKMALLRFLLKKLIFLNITEFFPGKVAKPQTSRVVSAESTKIQHGQVLLRWSDKVDEPVASKPMEPPTALVEAVAQEDADSEGGET